MCCFRDTFCGICERYLTFSCPEHGPGDAQDQPDSVCVRVRSTFSGALFGPIFHRIHSYFQKKITRKRELEPNSVGEADHFHATLPRSLHSPQVATAAPPSPLGPIGGVAVETCTWGATCPRGKRVGCAEQVLTEKTMKKLCFSLVWHEKTWKMEVYRVWGAV